MWCRPRLLTGICPKQLQEVVCDVPGECDLDFAHGFCENWLAAGLPTKGLKAVEKHIRNDSAKAAPREPMGVKGSGAIASGGGAVLGDRGKQSKVVEAETEEALVGLAMQR